MRCLVLILAGCALSALPPPKSPKIDYKERLARNPADREALLMAGRLEPLGDSSAAYLTKWIDLGAAGAEGPEVFLRLGQYHFSRGAYEKAGDFFSKNPAPEGRYWLGISEWALSKNESAKILFSSLSPEDSFHYGGAQLALAALSAAEGLWAESNQCLENALTALPPGRRGEVYYAYYRNFSAARDEKNAALYREKLLAEFPLGLEAEALRKNPAPATEAPHPNPGRYALQLGVFSLRENADRLRERLRVSYDEVEVVEIKMGGATRFHVWLGRFDSKEKAVTFAQSVLKALPKDYTVRLRE